MEAELKTFSGLKTMQLNDQKAGMEGLDKDVINKIIYEASKGTPYFAFQEKRQKSIDSKVYELQTEMKKITETERKDSLRKMDILSKSLEKERDLSHSIVHIDMDAFYAAVEMLDNPDFKDKPMAVGSSSMLSTSNYQARKYGVRAAMPGFIAKKLCPNLIIVPCNFDKYRSVSHKIRDIVAEYDPDYCAASLDEMYFDLTTYINNKDRKTLHEEYCLKNDMYDSFADDGNANSDYSDDYTNCLTCAEPVSDEIRDKMAFDIVKEIREKIFDTTQLTASAGIAPNTMLAKVCSDQNKPNGQYQICSSAELVKSFISTLPVKKVSGIGPVQGQILNSIGIHTCSDMWAKRDLVSILFTPNSVEFYMRAALGIGSTTVRSDYTRKSIGNEKTFREIHQPEELQKKCEELCNDLVEDLKSHHMLGKVVVLKIKTTNFVTHTRNHSLSYYTADSEVIYKAAKKLLASEIAAVAPQPLKLRLMGVRMCNLVYEDSVSSSEKQQITLKNFLQSKTMNLVKNSSEIKETFICPVCSEEYNSSFCVFNDHVNNCINNQNFTSDEKLETSLSNSMTTNACEENKSYCKVADSSKSSEEILKCPVCGLNPNVKNLFELNVHIDACLNKVAIKEILADDSQVTSKRKLVNVQKENSKRVKGSKRDKRIDEYFQ